MRCWVIRHVSRVHAKIETAQSHEIRHLDMVDRGTMVSFLISDHKFAPCRRITRSASRTLRAIHWHAVFNEGDPLQTERNFEAQPIGRWSAAEKNLCGAPVTCLCGNVQRRHLVPARQSVPGGTCIEQSAKVVVLSKPRGKHHDGKISVFFHVAAKRLKREELFPAMEYARNGTFLPSGVGGTECLPRSNRICSLFPACSAAIRARRVLLVHSGMTGKRSSTVSIISRFPPSSAIPRRSRPSLVGASA